MIASSSLSRIYWARQQVQVILGSLMGDAKSVEPATAGREARFRMGHGAKQAAYLDWKVSLLENVPHSKTSNAKGAVFADFTPLAELGELPEAIYFGDGKKHLSWDYLKSLTPLALAVWYMDDGCLTIRSKGVQERTRGGTGRIEICVEAMSPGSRERLASYLRGTQGLDVKLTSRGARKMSVLRFTTAASEKFQKLVAPHVHPSMDYKLLPRFRGKFTVEPEFVPPTLRPAPARVLSIKSKTDYPHDEQVRHRGRGLAQLSRRWHRGPQQPGDDLGRQGTQVLRLGPAGRAAH